MNKNAITPAIVEEGFESAKKFLGKLIMPAIEEVGLLIRDPVVMWKFRNEVNMLNKAKAICEKNKINPKAISLKLLVPLLSNASLEEDDEMQDKWAILLSNLVDSKQNIENHVFPYILSQLSSNEFKILEQVYEAKQKRLFTLRKEIDDSSHERQMFESETKKKIEDIETELAKIEGKVSFAESGRLKDQIRELKMQLKKNSYIVWSNHFKMKKLQVLPNLALKDFEVSNLVRLGLIKEQSEYSVKPQSLEIPLSRSDKFYNPDFLKVGIDIDIDSKNEIVLTQLGELFLSACKEKQGGKNAG